jgi:hypothetical protein
LENEDPNKEKENEENGWKKEERDVEIIIRVL